MLSAQWMCVGMVVAAADSTAVAHPKAIVNTLVSRATTMIALTTVAILTDQKHVKMFASVKLVNFSITPVASVKSFAS
jgi:methionine-rich copper-binding protein CopC